MSGLPEEKLPKDFGKYRLVRKIATGGMAEIFLAHRHDEPDAPLVVKRILPHLAESSDFVSMFLDEARIAAQLAHPNIVQIHDVGQIAGAYYISMEYIHGEDVRRIYNQAYKLQRSLPLSHSIRVIAEAALGLDFAHRLPDLTGRPLGVVHRDVSPQNILVTYGGGVKVVDFGIAKAANKVNQTRAGVLKGKYSYMSPEQALGEGLDHRTDIFALGIILYETTTGTRLFKRSSELATLQAVIKCEVTPPSDALAGYPVELEQIVLRALAKDPGDRYQSAQDLSDDLYHFLQSSGLYVAEDAISEFMQDLFADRLAEEAALGEPVLPQEHEIRAEMVPRSPSVVVSSVDEANAIAAPSQEVPMASVTDDTALSPRSQATFADEPRMSPGFSYPDEPSTDGTIPEEDHEDLLRAKKKPHHVSSARISVSPSVRPRSSAPPQVTAAGRPGKSSGDQAPTVVNQGAYRDPPKVTPRIIEPEKPERSSVVEETEFVRALAPKRSDTAPLGGPPGATGLRAPKENGVASRPNGKAEAGRARPAPAPSPRSRGPSGLPRWVVILGVTGVFCLGLGAALLGAWWKGAWTQEEGVADPHPITHGGEVLAETGFGEVTLVTEPGATVWAADKIMGQADAAGRAGPFTIPAGERTLRVELGDKGFERERVLQVRAGGIHEIEIRARPGMLRLAVAPWGKVKLDGKEEGITPLPSLNVVEGLHELVIENPDLQRRYKTMVRVQAGEVTDVKVDLTSAGDPM